MTIILDGKKLSEKITNNLAEKVANLSKKPHIAVILVGDNPANKLYVGIKQKKAGKIGIKSTVINYPVTTDEETLLIKIEELNNNDDINAILVQMPLPKHIDTKKVI